MQAGWSWPVIRTEINPKEEYFDALAQQLGLLNEPGGGRKTLGIEAARRYTRIRQLCPEDVGRLEDRIGAWLKHAP